MSARKLYHTKGEKGKKRREVVPFFVVKKAVVSFFGSPPH